MAAVRPLEQFEFHQTLDHTRGMALVFFSSSECSSCRYWEQLLDEYSRKYLDVRIFKVDAGRDQALTQEFGVFHLPALFLYMDGEFRAELQCEATLVALRTAIAQAMSAPPQEMP